MPAVLSAIVVTFGHPQRLGRYLPDVRVALDGVEGASELIVVDNHPGGDPAVAEHAGAAGAELVRPGRNLGFSGGVCAGLESCTGRWIALINDDARCAPEALMRMLAAGEADPGVGSVAAQVRFAANPEVLNSAGLSIDRLGIARDRRIGRPAKAEPLHPHEVFGASATLALYRRAMLDDIGGFDPSFFAYLEDADVAWRARARGWRCAYVPTAIAWHEGSATSGHASPLKHRLVGRNRVRLLAKNAPARLLRRHGPAMLAYDGAYVAFVAIRHASLAPVRGRLSGLARWRADRRRGAPTRAAVPLDPPAGLVAALRRRAAWQSAGEPADLAAQGPEA